MADTIVKIDAGGTTVVVAGLELLGPLVSAAAASDLSAAAHDAAAAASATSAAVSAAIAASSTDVAAEATAAAAAITAALGTSVLTLSQLVASGMPLNAKWFGANGNGTGDDWAAITAAIAESAGLAVHGYGYANGGPGVYIPYGVYPTSATIEWGHALPIRGDYSANIAGGGTVIKPTGAFTIFRALAAASGSTVEHLLLSGTYDSGVGTEAEAHGIEMQAKIAVRDNMILHMPGDGVRGSLGYNFNDAEVSGNFFQENRNSYYFEGGDGNALLISNNHHFLMRRYGGWMKDTIGESFIQDRDWSTNGQDSHRPTMSVQSGHRYYLLPLGDPTNAPSGTTANTAHWGYLDEQGTPGPTQPTYSAAIPFRSGGILRLEGLSNYNNVFGGYVEGDQPPASAQGNAKAYSFAMRGFDGDDWPTVDGSRAPHSFAVGCLPTGVGSAGNPTRPRGLNTSLENVDEMFRWRDHTDTVSWYMSIGPYGAFLKDASDSSKLIYHYNGSNGAYTLGRTTDYRQCVVFNRIAIGALSNARFVAMDNAVPSTGDRAQGEIVWNYAPALTAPAAWVCMVGHAITGGTWAADYIYARADPTTGIGYVAGAGGAVTQLTSKSTATPAINKVCGQITMNNAALASGAKVSFVVPNSVIAATDTVIVSVASGGTANAYRAAVTAISAGVSFTITVENITAGPLSEAPVINFAIIKAVAA